jgi:hypothetical protein
LAGSGKEGFQNLGRGISGTSIARVELLLHNSPEQTGYGLRAPNADGHSPCPLSRQAIRTKHLVHKYAVWVLEVNRLQV